MSNAYYLTAESVAEYIEMAKGVNAKGLIQKLRPFLPKGAVLLELGSGPGTDWKTLSGDYEITGSDFSPEFLRHLRKTYPEGEFIELDAVSLKIERQFDGIFSNKVLHHLRDEELAQSIMRQHEVLGPGGIICHSFWRGEGSEIFKGMFVNYHSAADLEQAFGSYFDILLMENYAEFEADDSILLIGRKKG